jgi:uncharacterized protein DUF2877
METRTQPPVPPAWASIAVSGLVNGPPRDLPVLASTGMAAYLTTGDRAARVVVLALLCEGAIRLPLGVCVGAGPLPPPGTTARAGDGIVTAAGRAWRPVRWWDPRPRLDAAALLRHGPRLLGLVHDAPAPAFGMPLAEALAVAGALAAGDPAPAVGVIGLGPGLTPAADDVIAGALAVLALTGRLTAAARHAVEARAATHTTGLSAALVAAAARGEVIPQAARVLALLAGGAPAGRIAGAAGGLLRVGHTSGHDLCAGMAGALAHLGGP